MSAGNGDNAMMEQTVPEVGRIPPRDIRYTRVRGRLLTDYDAERGGVGGQDQFMAGQRNAGAKNCESAGIFETGIKKSSVGNRQCPVALANANRGSVEHG